MNQTSTQQWTQPEPYEPDMSQMTDDDFQNFLNLDNIDLDFPIFESNDVDIQNQQSNTQDASATLPDATEMLDIDQYGDLTGNNEGLGEISQTTPQQYGKSVTMDFAAPPLYHQEHSNIQMLSSPNYMGHYGVPPTPNSAQMYPGNDPYSQQLDAQVSYSMIQQYRMRKDDVMASLTPLVSPQLPGSARPFAVLPEYTMPGAYLSPLTSPAMNAQPSTAVFPAYSRPRTADSSLAGSPIDLNFDMTGDLSTPIDEKRPRKTRKKAVSTKSSVSGPQPRPSSSTHRRRGSLSVTIPGEITSAMQDSPVPSVESGRSAQATRIVAVQSNLPQSNSDTLMAPPPKPGSVTNTPIALPKSKADSTGLPPATPASLMRLKQQQQSTISQSPRTLHGEASSPVTGALGSGMEDLRLPDAAAPNNDLDKVPTPRVFSRDSRSRRGSSVAIMTPCQTPRSILPSPAVSAIGGKSEAKNNKGSRKRNSAGSSLVSPALRPKISPSIKPLLPEGPNGVSSETHTLLLASKSNYQNIIEGTTLPGVTYPAELSTNLTSKRTSHKIAEQGRRNRINTALQEMQSLLPTSPAFGLPKESAAGSDGGAEESPPIESGAGSGSNNGDGEGLAGGQKTPSSAAAAAAAAAALQGGNSKAATVELAIEYIRHLNGRLADKETENERLKAEMNALREKLEGSGGGV